MRQRILLGAIVALTMFPHGRALSAQANKAEGRRIYRTYCSSCHGETGKGDGLAAQSLPVKPADHADGKVMSQHSDKYLFDIITRGGAAVGKSPLMPAWGGQFKDEQIRDLTAHIRALAGTSSRPAQK